MDLSKGNSAQQSGNAPLVGEVRRLRPGEEVIVVRQFSLSDDLFLADHILIHAPGIKPLNECFPVVPMTMAIEMLAETAGYLVPDLKLIGFETIRISRWIALEDSDTITVDGHGRLTSVDDQTGRSRVQVNLLVGGQVRARAKVIFGSEYRQDVALHFTPIEKNLTWRFRVEDIYRERHMFHGPAFQCISGLYEIGENGFTASLKVPANDGLFTSNANPELLIDPCLTDAIGQLLECWVLSRSTECYIMPIGVDRIELYGPSPAAGTEVLVRVEIIHYDPGAKLFKADIEVRDGADFVWMRLVGWSDRIFSWKTSLIDSMRFPQRFFLTDEIRLAGEQQGQASVIFEREILDDAVLNWVARIYLHSSEMRESHLLEPDKLRHRDWLAERIAAKDAVRRWLTHKTGRDAIHPAQIWLAEDSQGGLFVEPLSGYDDVPELTLSTLDGQTLALARNAAARSVTPLDAVFQQGGRLQPANMDRGESPASAVLYLCPASHSSANARDRQECPDERPLHNDPVIPPQTALQ